MRRTPPHVAPPLARALEEAVLAHAGQKRKHGRVPYAVHPLRVVGRLVAWGVRDEDVLCAAALHDVVEDTPVTLEAVRAGWGPRVAALVDTLTHAPGLPHEERTRVILRQLAASPPEALLVKLADRLDNIHEMEGWRATSRLGYLGEAAQIADAVRGRLPSAAPWEEPLTRALAEYESAVAEKRAEAERDLERARGEAGFRARS